MGVTAKTESQIPGLMQTMIGDRRWASTRRHEMRELKNQRITLVGASTRIRTIGQRNTCRMGNLMHPKAIWSIVGQDIEVKNPRTWNTGVAKFQAGSNIRTWSTQ